MTAPTPHALPRRSELPAEVKWRLEDMYPSNDQWEKDFKQVRARLPEISSYQGKLMASADNLLAALRLRDRIGELMERIYAYARMRRDEDNTVATYQAMTDRATALLTEVGAATAFLAPEILAAEPEQVERMLQDDQALQLYRHDLQDTLRHKPHTLPTEQEQLLAQTGEMAQAPHTIFNMLNDADMKFPTIRDEDGNEVQLTKGRYSHFLESRDRRVRKDAFETLYGTYEKYLNTLAATYASSVKKDVFFARARKYPSALEASLHEDNVPVSVYTNLIDTVHRFLPALSRYLKVRKKRLGLDDLHMYDLYTPIVNVADRKIPFEEAVATVEKALQPMGAEYLTTLKEGLREHWIDVYENEGKTGGAYSWGCYGVHPFVLLNYQENTDNMFTLAHEMGHAMHSHFTQAAQPYVYAHYTIFVAEVASTFNENLLLHHLLQQTKDPQERLYLINHHLEAFRTTVFRQTMFAEFEMLTHRKVEEGEALTPELLCSLYRDLNRKYYGAEAVIDDQIALEWSRIPHFYTPFYVYKYATGYSAATALSQQVLKEGESAVKRYLNFLKSGSTDYPIELLKGAGVDMATPKPVEQALTVFEGLVEEMEKAGA
ncbi:MAG: oligoendopeptidase F [Bacillota bacterium]